MTRFNEFLNETYSVNNLKTELTRLTHSLVMRTHPRKQVILNGLIGVVLGAYSLNDKKVSELTKEFIDRYLELL